mmetsp:Transcript_48248/g.53996  ORF Transcript_48248/g.53996 Transcript_48248/m.53996 type:complete len:240 (+) Transcript_48248:236-955(+)
MVLTKNSKTILFADDDDDVIYQVPAATADGKNPVIISTIISSGAGAAADDGKSTSAAAADKNASVDEKMYAYAKRILLAVNFFVESSRMEPFVAVYYIVFKEWNPTNFGVVSLVMSITMLVAQTPVGDILDKTTHKKLITAGAVFIAAVTTTSVAWTSNFWIVVLIKAVEGLAATVFHLSLTLLIFGIVRTKEEGEIHCIVCCVVFVSVCLHACLGFEIKHKTLALSLSLSFLSSPFLF